MSENTNRSAYYMRKKFEQKRRIAQRKRKQQRILFLFIVSVVLIFIISLIIKSIFSAIFSPDTPPPPTPVPIITEAGKILNLEEESEIVTEEPEIITSLPDAKSQNDILKFLEDSQSNKKVCYLTFDDGPNKTVTPKILDILRRYNIKATFFQVGTMIKENKDVAERVYEEGHLIGGHSYDHTYSKIYETAQGFASEMNDCNALIKKITGDDYFPLIRFPGGSYNSGTYGEKKQEYIKILSDNGIYHCDWNALNGDAEGNAKSPEQLLERTIKSAEGKNQVVVLMHDAATKQNTVDSLPSIIEHFISEGYIFSTLDKPVLN